MRAEQIASPVATLLLEVRGGDRRALAKAITLVESTRPQDRIAADELLIVAGDHRGKSLRIGVSGVPGVGKSTFIETVGLRMVGEGLRIAVLAIDPSSSLSGGSILGDKTRMQRLSASEAVFIRPSPTSGTLGGVAARTREAVLLCEAAGYDIILIETVGVGQSETAVAGMADLFLLLQLPNAGDDLQAIKRGVMELADIVVVNKADLDQGAATRAAMQLQSRVRGEFVRVVSGLTGEGIDALLLDIRAHPIARNSSGEREARRRKQALDWMWESIRARLLSGFNSDPRVQERLPETLSAVASGQLSPTIAARRLLELFESS